MAGLLSLPRELRDEIYSYFIPDFPMRYHLLTSRWTELEESDAVSCSARTASTRRGSVSSLVSSSYRASGSTIFSDEAELDKEDREHKAAMQALLLLNKQIHFEYVDALQRSNTNMILYLYMENTPERPQEFVFDPRVFGLEYNRAIQKLIVLARWHAGEGWEMRNAEKEAEVSVLDDDDDGEGNARPSNPCGTPANPGEIHHPSGSRNDPVLVPDAHTHLFDESSSHEMPSIAVEPERTFYNAFDESRDRHYFHPVASQLAQDPAFIGRPHVLRRPADLLDASQTTTTLFETVKLVLQSLPNVGELHVTLDVGGATSEDLAAVCNTNPERGLKVKDFMEWKPAPEDGLERVVHVNKRLLAGSYKAWPSGMEEWRKNVVEVKSGTIVPREEDGGWLDIMEEECVSTKNDVNWHIWPAPHCPYPVDSTGSINNHTEIATGVHMMEGDNSVKKWRHVPDPYARWAIKNYKPEANREEGFETSSEDFEFE
ncbi:hypothetical protein K505DRAFT_414660 [Melanomma pulvis-pyrius CBS 109.77]|uniref:Uncharacterized protein n=1 Tax=Melanomma pulvis-pyrius CBS 109.77 TaxID=1314802 RepID=A0A6A6XN99_9PLEO|nr:hypothetical protein K505DRAFT_414660 [Melanomma pulvis-pyrius CBS 109.77]